MMRDGNRKENMKFRNLTRRDPSSPDNGGTLPLIKQSELDVAQRHASRAPSIPHIIHQTWDTYHVPATFVPWIKSVVEKHPNWTYLFWTQDDVMCYFRNMHRDAVDLYTSYGPTIFKTDVMRYFLLYDFGGFYLDLDVECLKPLDVWSHYAPCLLTHETYEHVFLIKDLKNIKANVMTTVMASRPHHPYFALLQSHLESYRDKYRTDVLRATGPHFMQDILDMYLATDVTEADEQVSVINPAYWLPTFDPFLEQKIKYKCDNKYRSLKRFAKDLCDAQVAEKYKNQPSDNAYLDHHWVHTNLKPVSFKLTDLVDIRSVIPKLVNVSQHFGFDC